MSKILKNYDKEVLILHPVTDEKGEQICDHVGTPLNYGDKVAALQGISSGKVITGTITKQSRASIYITSKQEAYGKPLTAIVRKSKINRIIAIC